ncbi:GGDEF domain-containing protein [Oleidesulfovibrio alaskensis]|uniref:GGDEF domain-containing protein n=1 Tax=Oleidesulfovibrio alaskensis TaxID=58180 RepID=UPI000402F0C3|nr:GGDEF domain-containing protein [Oleidesulfovibrio alaskensis]
MTDNNQDLVQEHEGLAGLPVEQPPPPSFIRIFWLPVILYAGFVLLFVYWAGAEAEKEALADLDARLRVAAVALPGMLASDFHDRAIAPGSVGIDEELKNRERFNRYAAEAGMIYVYTLVQFRDGFCFSSPTVTVEEAQERRSWFFYPYENPPPAFMKALQTNTAQYVSYADEWGRFRSVAVPMTSPSGRRYLACADIQLQEVHEEIRQRQQFALLASLGFMLLGVPFLLAGRQAVAIYARYSLGILSRNMKLKRLAEHDSLTGLLNRVSFFRVVDQRILMMRQVGAQGALLMIDIDDFKEINSRHGHLFGDEVLLGVSHILRQTARKQDTAGRYGGEELMLFLPDASADAARSVAERLCAQVGEMPFTFQGRTIRCTVSIGVAHFTAPSDMAMGYAEVADNALRQAKRHGKNNVVVLGA